MSPMRSLLPVGGDAQGRDAMALRRSAGRRGERRCVAVRPERVSGALAAGALVLDAQGECAAAAALSVSTPAARAKPSESRKRRARGAVAGRFPRRGVSLRGWPRPLRGLLGEARPPLPAAGPTPARPLLGAPPTLPRGAPPAP